MRTHPSWRNRRRQVSDPAPEPAATSPRGDGSGRGGDREHVLGERVGDRHRHQHGPRHRHVDTAPEDPAVTPAGTRVYVTDLRSDDVSAIDTDTTTVTVGDGPEGVAIATVETPPPSGDRPGVGNSEIVVVPQPLGVLAYPASVAVLRCCTTQRQRPPDRLRGPLACVHSAGFEPATF
ncbi:hypothetical protein [Streptomyces xantholiticus]|uniref:hypothetical protein n=1 Tax=Streptomyces xantholiticus TaxID=68285 RepID=UPI0035713905